MRFWFSVLLFILAAGAQNPAPTFSPALTGGLTKSEYEKDPSGWTGLIPADGNFKEWTRVGIGTEKLSIQSQWFVDPETKHIVCSGDQGHEWIRYDHELSNFVLHVEWRFFPGQAKYNSGVFVRNNADGTVWHQAQVAPDGGYLFGVTPMNGVPKRIDLKQERKENRVRPVGEWNAYEITAIGGKLSLWVNGAVTSVMYNLEVFSGFAGLEAEGAKTEFRNIRLKELPANWTDRPGIHD